jgi:tetratricopeptide (TPR) repeat protein
MAIQGYKDESLSEIEKLLVEFPFATNEALLIKSFILNKMGKFEDALDLSQTFIKANEEEDQNELHSLHRIVRSFSFLKFGNYGKVEELLFGESLLDQIEDLWVRHTMIAVIDNIRGLVFWKKGDLAKSIEYHSNAIERLRENNVNELLGIAMNDFSPIYSL